MHNNYNPARPTEPLLQVSINDVHEIHPPAADYNPVLAESAYLAESVRIEHMKKEHKAHATHSQPSARSYSRTASPSSVASSSSSSPSSSSSNQIPSAFTAQLNGLKTQVELLSNQVDALTSIIQKMLNQLEKDVSITHHQSEDHMYRLAMSSISHNFAEPTGTADNRHNINNNNYDPTTDNNSNNDDTETNNNNNNNNNKNNKKKA